MTRSHLLHDLVVSLWFPIKKPFWSMQFLPLFDMKERRWYDDSLQVNVNSAQSKMKTVSLIRFANLLTLLIWGNKDRNGHRSCSREDAKPLLFVNPVTMLSTIG